MSTQRFVIQFCLLIYLNVSCYIPFFERSFSQKAKMQKRLIHRLHFVSTPFIPIYHFREFTKMIISIDL